MYIYLHGFNSGGGSAKAAQLRTLLAPVAVLSPTYPVYQAGDALALLRNYVGAVLRDQSPATPLVLVGSSLGGFYAAHLAREFSVRMVLINPSIHPYDTLGRCLGPNHNAATGEDYTLNADHLRKLRQHSLPVCDPGVPTLLLLDTADELLDYRVAEAWYQGCGETLVYTGGSHRFEHLTESVEAIRRLHDL